MLKLPVVIVLAAGRGERFAASGGTTHKLDALLAGCSVIDHVLRAVRESGLQHHVVRPDRLPDGGTNPGMGDSIAAGVAATSGAAGWLILPADLPLIRAATLRRIASVSESAVVVPRFHGMRGHPVFFSADCRQELLNLGGNQGAAHILRARDAIDSVAFINVDDEGCVTDIDTVDDLRRAEALLAQR